MVDIPSTANSVYVSMVKTGSSQNEFDSTYPIHLNGIISQGEFVESIKKINRTISGSGGKKTICIIFTLIIFTLIIFLGMFFFIFGAINAVNSHSHGFPPLVGVGVGLVFFGMFVSIIRSLIIESRQAKKMRQAKKKMRQAIAEESMKYSARSPTPCSWRLEATSNGQAAYYIIIDIGRATTAPTAPSGAYYSNQNANASSYITVERNQYAPPPYSSLFAAFCSKCGATQSDLSARFCSSCGQAFNKS